VTIAAIVVVCNEAHRLAATLAALRPVVDELVVVDQDSRDGSDAIARHFADVFLTDRCWGFPEPSREMADATCTTEWRLIVDADESLTDRFAEELVRLIAAPDADAYRLPRATYFDGAIALEERPGLLRLYRRGAIAHFGALHHDAKPRRADRVRDVGYLCIEHRKTWDEQHLDDARYAALTATKGGS
jgi:(heptosyl)LPS beta-1,4-glucosyltransferase